MKAIFILIVGILLLGCSSVFVQEDKVINVVSCTVMQSPTYTFCKVAVNDGYWDVLYPVVKDDLVVRQCIKNKGVVSCANKGYVVVKF